MNGCNHIWMRTLSLEEKFWTDLIIEQVLGRSLKLRGGLTQGRGMTESVRYQWVYIKHQRAAFHDV